MTRRREGGRPSDNARKGRLPGPKRRPWAVWVAVAAAAAVLLGNRGLRRLVSRVWQMRQMNRQLSVLAREESDLKVRIEAAKKGDFEIERAARKELDYLKPGEVEYRFPPPAGEKPKK